MKLSNEMKEWLGVGAIFAFVFLFFIGFSSVFFIDAGQVGIKFNRFTGKVSTYYQGSHLKLSIIERITKFDVKIKLFESLEESASKDLQVVTIKVAINYYLQYDKVKDIYTTVGKDYEKKVIIPAVSECVKAGLAKYPVEEIIMERVKLKELVYEALEVRLKEYNIVLTNVNFINIDFKPEFNEAIEKKQIEQQKIKTAEYQRLQAEQYKEKTILEAQAEAEKQRLLQQSASKEILALNWISKWDGRLPHFIAGDKQSFILDLNSIKNEE